MPIGFNKLIRPQTWRMRNTEGSAEVEIEGQFPAVGGLSRNVAARWEETNALNRQNPILQFVGGENDTVQFASRFRQYSAFDTEPAEKLEQLISWTRIDPKLRRPPIISFALGDGTDLTANVVILAVQDIIYDQVNVRGDVTDFQFTLNLKRIEPFDLDAEEVLDTRYAAVRERDYWEWLCEEEYKNPLIGVALRQRNPTKARLVTGDRVPLPAVEAFAGITPAPQSIALRTAFGRKDTVQRALFKSVLADRSKPRFSFPHRTPGAARVGAPPLPVLITGDGTGWGDDVWGETDYGAGEDV